MNNTIHCSRRNFLFHSAALSAAAVISRPLATLASEPNNPPWQIGCYTRPWAQHDYKVALDAIAAAGFQHCGLMTTKAGLILSAATTLEQAQQVGNECQQRGLKIASVWAGDISVAKSLQAGIDALRKIIDNCAAAAASNLLMGGVANEKLHNDYYKAIAECCPYAAEKKLGISIKPHGGTNSTGPQCRKTIELVNHKNFGLWYDPGNIFYYSDGKLDPIDDAATVDNLVVGMSVKDFQPPKDVALTPGTGQVNFPKVLARLKLGRFTAGPLIIECLAPGDLPQLLAEAKKARAFVEQLVA